MTSCGGGGGGGSASGDSTPPVAGNGGVLTILNVLDRGGYIQFAGAADDKTSQDLLQYRAYYSTSNNLNTVAQIESNGTPIGNFSAVSQWTAGKVQGGINLSGLSYVNAGNPAGLNFGTNDFTLEAWIKPSTWGSTAGIIGKGARNNSDAGYALRLIVTGTGNGLDFIIGDGTSRVRAFLYGYAPDQWYHVAGVADRTNNALRLYVNGALAASTDITGFTGSIDSAIDLTIGRQSYNLTGLIDEAAIYNRALTAAEVTDRYNAGSGKSVDPAIPGGLLAGWKLDEASGATASDISGNGYTGALVNPDVLPALGLDSATAYYFNVIVKDEAGNKAAYGPATATTLNILPISFLEQDISYNGFMPSVADINNDGYIEQLGTLNDGIGNLAYDSYQSMGLDGIFAPGRVNRDCRVADFNGDGFPDVVCNTYSPEEVYDGSVAVPQCQAASFSYDAASIAKLFFNNGDGTFTESADFASLAIRGFGETILAADFNNDGFLDIYLPHYSFCSSNEHSYLLMNDGTGKFTDISDAAGVALRNRPAYYQVEGLQALDFDRDGWIDFYAAGHFFMNNGCAGSPCSPTFTDKRALFGLPDVFDEGIKFLDWNNDGYMDLIIHYPGTTAVDGTPGTALYQFNSQTNVFSRAYPYVIPTYSYQNSYGVNAFDLNSDGREDIIIAGGTLNNTVVLLNYGTTFQLAATTPLVAHGNNDVAFGDIDGDGRPEVLKNQGQLGYYRNQTAVPDNNYFMIDVVGPNNEKNQQGRVVRIQPPNHPSITYTRVVDSGSGWMSQSQYDLLVGTPYLGAHTVKVYFAGGVVRTFTINPGERKRVFPNGTVVDY